MTATIGAMRRVGVLEGPAETETVFGGRVSGWSPLASLWVAMGAQRDSERAPGGRGASRDVAAPERPVTTCEAEARAHPLAARGLRLTVEGLPWRIAAVDRGRPAAGRMMLSLVRD